MSGHFEVLFHGEIYASVDPDKAQADMAELFRQPLEAVKRLFNGKTWVLKDNLDRETAERYQVELAKIGLISELRDRSPKFVPKKAPERQAKSQNFTIESIAISRMTCPACGYEQLEADYCARCGANIERAVKRLKQKEREDRVLQERIQQLHARTQEQLAVPPPAEAAATVAPPRMRVGAAPVLQVTADPSRSSALLWVVAGVAVALLGAGVLLALEIIDLPF